MLRKSAIAALGFLGVVLAGTAGGTTPASAGYACGPWNNFCRPVCGPWNGWCAAYFIYPGYGYGYGRGAWGGYRHGGNWDGDWNGHHGKGKGGNWDHGGHGGNWNGYHGNGGNWDGDRGDNGNWNGHGKRGKGRQAGGNNWKDHD
jgi:hypothetical protein